jgi:hypothetical protein
MKLVGRFLVSIVAPFAFIALLSSPASAWERERCDRDEQPKLPFSAPEIDPAALGSAFALLSGGALLLNARRVRKAQ